ncbi:Cellulose synthase subunit D [Methylobacterium sp. ap11]|uniref:cellulose biosynthesis protein BcsD n=1 Tax=Methylobacterium sp. ap11 TaxID=1761799 RepID=UPI0008CED7FC|nr:cellulose biosynthesis protein BcsD [Methylobacterium sp. ap11]SEP44018.1 Cellulose synthase subunit D [Methylobacterium sp. ap11]
MTNTPDLYRMAERPRWRLFLRVLAARLDVVLDAEQRDALLRDVGADMARGAALPPVSTLDALEDEINEVLADLGWGRASLAMDEAGRILSIVHTHLPTIGSIEGRRGPWLSAVLEGLYTTWLGQQPHAAPGLVARRTGRGTKDVLVLAYGRASAMAANRA